MMGQQRRAESLFHYFRLEEQIPSDASGLSLVHSPWL
jgi:hypothetical protein